MLNPLENKKKCPKLELCQSELIHRIKMHSWKNYAFLESRLDGLFSIEKKIFPLRWIVLFSWVSLSFLRLFFWIMLSFGSILCLCYISYMTSFMSLKFSLRDFFLKLFWVSSRDGYESYDSHESIEKEEELLVSQGEEGEDNFLYHIELEDQDQQMNSGGSAYANAQGHVWRYFFKADLPVVLVNHIFKSIKKNFQASDTKLFKAMQYRGGIEMRFLIKTSLMNKWNEVISNLNKVNNKAWQLQSNESLPIEYHPMSWYKVFSKKVLPKDMNQVVIWIVTF